MKTKKISPSIEANLYQSVRDLILNARKTVARGVDLVQVHTNFAIGRHIVEHEQQGSLRAGYGEKIIKNLANRLIVEFGKGFSKRNLEIMRQFYLTYSDRHIPIAQTVSAQFKPKGITQTLSAQSKKQNHPAFNLGWSHYVLMLGIKNTDERRFYEIEATDQNWTVRELRRQFNSSLYERLALSRNKKQVRKLAEKGQEIAQPQDLLKEPLVLEFLGLDEQRGYSESDLETAIINQIEHSKLTHQDLGQMQMYVNYFDRFVKTKTEKPTIGMVLCKEKKDTLVKITLPKKANIHAKEYQLYLPSKEELQKKLAEWTNGA